MASAAEAGGKYLAFLGRFSARVFLHARESRVSPGRQRRPERELAAQLCLLRERKHIRMVYNAALVVSVVETLLRLEYSISLNT